MSTRQIRTLHDFARHRRDIEVTCYCGHKAVLPYVPVIAISSRENWPIGFGVAASYFRCSKCGSAPAFIGPRERSAIIAEYLSSTTAELVQLNVVLLRQASGGVPDERDTAIILTIAERQCTSDVPIGSCWSAFGTGVARRSWHELGEERTLSRQSTRWRRISGRAHLEVRVVTLQSLWSRHRRLYRLRLQ